MKSPAEFLEMLRALWRTRHDEVRAKWNRSLALGDYVVDRWEKARLLGFGEGTSVYDSCLILGDVRVGEHCWIGPYTVLDGSGGTLEIGSYVSISSGVHIYTHDTVRWAISGGKVPYDYAPTRIGSRVYIGPQTVISRGVTVGDGCVIGACSLVNTSLPPGCRAWGQPARIVGKAEDFSAASQPLAPGNKS
jgi:acetyltransferase-like isoleucine patch superfamily enzyme